MNSDHILMLLAALAEQSGEKVSEFRLEFAARKLEPLGVEKVCAALERLIETARRFPTVAEVKAEMGESELTVEDEARMISEAIMKGVRQFGEIPPGNQRTPAAVRLAVGESAWEVVGRSGGWNAMVERVGENEMAARAQVRDLASVYLRTGTLERGTLPERMPGASEALAEANRVHRLALPEAPRMSDGERMLLEAKLVDLKKQRAEELERNQKAYEQAKRELERED